MQVELPGKYGGPRLRDGLVVVLFKRGSPVRWAPQVLTAFDLWLGAVPDGAKIFALIGASSTKTKPANARTIDRCLAMLKPEKVRARDITSFNVQGPQKTNPDFFFETRGDTKPGKTQVSYLTMRFPTEWAEDGGDLLADFVLELSECVSFDSGYAGAALHWSVDAEMLDIRKDIPALAFRHPGFDLQDFWAACYTLGDEIWGAQWITLLGPKVLQRVGGKQAVVNAVPEFSVQETPNGIMVRSPLPPRGGDTNLGDCVEELLPLAGLLEPVTISTDEIRFFSDRSDAERWHRRFID